MEMAALALQLCERVLSAEHQHRCRFRIRHAHAGERVGEARSRNHETRGDSTGCPRVSRCHEGCALFMADRDDAERVVPVSTIEQRVVVGPHNSEYVLYAFGLQRGRDRLAPRHGCHVSFPDDTGTWRPRDASSQGAASR